MSEHMQMLVDGEWVDIKGAGEVTFTPAPREDAISDAFGDSGSRYSMTLDIERESAVRLRDLIEREAQRQRWAKRLWLRNPL